MTGVLSKHVCSGCKLEIAGDYPERYGTVPLGVIFDPTLSCPECSAPMKWTPNPKPRDIDVTFDYYCQVNRDSNGNVVNEHEGEMTCPECMAPSVMYSSDAFFEYNRCLNSKCRHEFTSN